MFVRTRCVNVANPQAILRFHHSLLSTSYRVVIPTSLVISFLRTLSDLLTTRSYFTSETSPHPNGREAWAYSQSTAIKSYLGVHEGDDSEGNLYRNIDSDRRVSWGYQTQNSGSIDHEVRRVEGVSILLQASFLDIATQKNSSVLTLFSLDVCSTLCSQLRRYPEHPQSVLPRPPRRFVHPFGSYSVDTIPQPLQSIFSKND